MPPNPEDNQDDGNTVDLPPDQYSLGDQRNEVVPYQQPLVPSSNSAQPSPTITSLGGVYTPRPDVDEDVNGDEDDVLDAEWRYADPSASDPSARRVRPEPNAAGGSVRSGPGPRPFWRAAAGRSEGGPLRDPRDVELEEAALREANRKEVIRKAVQGLLVVALSLGGGAVVGKVYNELNNPKPSVADKALKFDGTNMSEILGLGDNFKVEQLTVNPEWYSYPVVAEGANGAADRYEVVTPDGQRYTTGEGIEVGLRKFYPFNIPNGGTWYLIEDITGGSYNFARVVSTTPN